MTSEASDQQIPSLAETIEPISDEIKESEFGDLTPRAQALMDGCRNYDLSVKLHEALKDIPVKHLESAVRDLEDFFSTHEPHENPEDSGEIMWRGYVRSRLAKIINEIPYPVVEPLSGAQLEAISEKEADESNENSGTKEIV